MDIRQIKIELGDHDTLILTDIAGNQVTMANQDADEVSNRALRALWDFVNRAGD